MMKVSAENLVTWVRETLVNGKEELVLQQRQFAQVFERRKDDVERQKRLVWLFEHRPPVPELTDKKSLEKAAELTKNTMKLCEEILSEEVTREKVRLMRKQEWVKRLDGLHAEIHEVTFLEDKVQTLSKQVEVKRKKEEEKAKLQAQIAQLEAQLKKLDDS